MIVCLNFQKKLFEQSQIAPIKLKMQLNGINSKQDTINKQISRFNNTMKPTPREAKQIHEKYDKVVKHLIDEKYAVDKDAADKIISGMSQDWYDTIAE